MKLRRAKRTRFASGAAAQGLMTGAGLLLVVIETQQDWLREKAHELGFGELWLVLLLGVIALACATAAAILSDRTKKRLQPVRDFEGRQEDTYVLFLRPFFSDNWLLQPNPFWSAWSQGVTLDAPGLRPEEFVGSVLEPLIAVREVGGNPAIIGNARIELGDEVWQQGVQNAIHSATAVLVLPLLERDRKSGVMRGEATVWELNYLIDSGRMERTLVMMPQAPLVRKRKLVHEVWERTRERVWEMGLDLPPYDPKGGVFAFEQVDGTWIPARAFRPETSRKLRMATALVEGVRYMATRFDFPLRSG